MDERQFEEFLFMAGWKWIRPHVVPAIRILDKDPWMPGYVLTYARGIVTLSRDSEDYKINHRISHPLVPTYENDCVSMSVFHTESASFVSSRGVSFIHAAENLLKEVKDQTLADEIKASVDEVLSCIQMSKVHSS